jgi:hypothetical protein
MGSAVMMVRMLGGKVPLFAANSTQDDYGDTNGGLGGGAAEAAMLTVREGRARGANGSGGGGSGGLGEFFLHIPLYAKH